MVGFPHKPQDETELRAFLRDAEFQYSVLDPERHGLEVEIRLRMHDVLEGRDVRGIAPNWTPVERGILHPGFREDFRRRIDHATSSGAYMQTVNALAKRFQAVTSREPSAHELRELQSYARCVIEARATIAALKAVLETNPRAN